MANLDRAAHEGFTLKQFAGAIFAVICAMAAGFWALHLALTDRLRDRITAYEQAKQWELPQLLKSVGGAADRLEKQLARAQSVESLTQRAGELGDQLAVAHEKAAVMAARVTELERELSEIRSDNLEFTLSQGESKTLAGNIPVGLVSGSVIRECEVVVDNRNERLKPGAYISIDLLDRSCRVIIEECSSATASFRWVCTKHSRPAT